VTIYKWCRSAHAVQCQHIVSMVIILTKRTRMHCSIVWPIVGWKVTIGTCLNNSCTQGAGIIFCFKMSSVRRSSKAIVSSEMTSLKIDGMHWSRSTVILTKRTQMYWPTVWLAVGWKVTIGTCLNNGCIQGAGGIFSFKMTQVQCSSKTSISFRMTHSMMFK
jgi:hypothetical protein